jgi:hypothetical protein
MSANSVQTEEMSVFDVGRALLTFEGLKRPFFVQTHEWCGQYNTENCLKKNCNEKCPQAERAYQIAVTRQAVTKELVRYIKMIECGLLVEVIRCEKCKHFSPRNEIEGVSWTGWCNYGEFHTDEDDFCSRGERKENETD